MSRWFAHEDELKEGEKDSEPILGPRYSPFWFFGMAVIVGFAIMGLYMALKFMLSAAHASH